MLSISRIVCTRCSSVRLIRPNSLIQPNQFSTSIEEKIEIPKRIHRNATDILRALESTVGRDPTAAHYKYHDDPYLIPMSNTGKRTFAMAQEAGRKAAHWVREQHADLFQHKEADPPVEAFIPPMVYHENSLVTQEDLEKLIQTAQVTDAKLVYKLLLQNKVEIPQKLTQDLLELMCFQNCEDGLPEEFVEERWFMQSTKAKEKVRKTWRDGDFAEELFIGIENPQSAAYSAIIQGMAKYHQVDRAWQLFEEALEKNIIVNTNTYNSIISVANFLKENFEMRWTFVMNLLIQMEKAKLKPNLGTLNAILYCLSTMSNKSSKETALKVLAEFRILGIEPSLASWYHILNTFCRERGPVSTILNDIMNEIENKEHEIRDVKDTHFFYTAMDLCRHHLRDVELARRVNKLLHHGNNYNLIGDSYKESIYFRHYFALLAANLPLDEFMKDVYEPLVPHIYVPEPLIMAKVVEQVEANGAIGYVPKLWSDMVVFDHTQRESLIELILNVMINNEQLSNAELNAEFARIGWDIYNRLENQNENKANKIAFTGDLLGKIMTLLLRNDDFEKGCLIMNKLDKNQHVIVGVPKFEPLSLFVDHCIRNKSPSIAISCIQYCSNCGFPEANALAARLHEKLNLDEEFLKRLTKIVGNFSIEKHDTIP